MGFRLRLPTPLQSSSWKRVAVLNAACIGFLSAFLLAILIYTCSRAGGVEAAVVLYQGPCAQSTTINLLLHLLLNVLGTLILASSNFFMQILNAPSRSELDRAHARSAWVVVGVPSFRNLVHLGPLKLTCWLVLACSSVPIHLFFNSLVFQVAEIRSNFGLTIAAEPFVQGAEHFAPGMSLWNTAAPFNCSILGLPGHKENDKLCKTFLYDEPQISTYSGNVFPATWKNESSDEGRNVSHAAQARTLQWDQLDAATCRKEFLYCGSGLGLRDYLNVVLVVGKDIEDETTDGWTRDQVFPNMTNTHAAFWDDVVPKNQTNTLWHYEDCKLLSSFDNGKCENSCKPSLGSGRVFTTAGLYTVDPRNDTGEATWKFSFWDQLSLDRGILNAQTRSGFDERYSTLDVQYCLAEKTEQICKIGMSNTLLLAVVICVLAKTGQCIFVVLRFVLREDQNPLVTLGDAVDSLIRRPDPTTSHMCSLDMRDIQTNLGRNSKRSRTPKSYDDDALGMEILHGDGRHELLAHMARQWRNETPRYFEAIPHFAWIRTYAIFLTVLGVALYYFYQATEGSFRASGAFGSSGMNKFVTQNQGSSDQYTGNFVQIVVLANVPQLVLSISYLQFNSVITKLSIAKEWALMSTDYKPLRVTEPKGEQVSTYRLQLPYSWGIPCIMIGILIHWLVSNACYVFIADGGFYGSENGSPTMQNNKLGLSDYGFVALGYSTTGIMISIIVFAVILCIPLVLAFKKLPGKGTIVGSNSLAIAAACHASECSKAEAVNHTAVGHLPRRIPQAVRGGESEYSILHPYNIEMTQDGDRATGAVLASLAESRIKWGVVTMPHGFYEDLNDDVEAAEIKHISFGVEADDVTVPVHGDWYT